MQTSSVDCVWQRRFYAFNVWSHHKEIEKLRYHPPQPGRARTDRETGGLAVEQLQVIRQRGAGAGTYQ